MHLPCGAWPHLVHGDFGTGERVAGTVAYHLYAVAAAEGDDVVILAVDVAADQLHAPAAFVVDDGGVDGVVVRAEIETGVDAAGVVVYVAEFDPLAGGRGDGQILQIGFGVAVDE